MRMWSNHPHGRVLKPSAPKWSVARAAFLRIDSGHHLFGRNLRIPGHCQVVEDCLRVVKHGGEVRTPVHDALETHRLVHRILEAAGLPGLA